jgi:threonine dehydratase
VKAGQGTAALEILEDEPQISAIVAPIGGGGLISGLATAAKGQKPGLVMVGVEPSATPRYKQSRQAHTALTIKTKFTIADGTRGNYASPANFPLIEERVDELIDVDDDMLMAGIYAYACQAKLVAEPSGALPMAALLSGQLSFLKGQKVCLVVSGGNLDFSHYADWLITGAEIVTSYGLCPHDVTIV